MNTFLHKKKTPLTDSLLERKKKRQQMIVFFIFACKLKFYNHWLWSKQNKQTEKLLKITKKWREQSATKK